MRACVCVCERERERERVNWKMFTVHSAIQPAIAFNLRAKLSINRRHLRDRIELKRHCQNNFTFLGVFLRTVRANRRPNAVL